jgi:hypothetical protein
MKDNSLSGIREAQGRCFCDPAPKVSFALRGDESFAGSFTLLSKSCYRIPRYRAATDPNQGRRMFQIVRLELDRDGRVVARRPLQPSYDLWEDAMALAEFDASRCAGAYGYDDARDCWWARENGRSYRFLIEQIVPLDTAS